MAVPAMARPREGSGHSLSGLDDSSHHSYAQLAEIAVKFWMISRVSPCDLSVKRSICCIGKNFVLALYPRFASSVRVVLKKANLLKNRDAKFPV